MTLDYHTTVAFVTNETPSVYTLGVHVPTAMAAPKSGQFFMIGVAVEGVQMRRPYSYSAWHDGVVEFCIKRIPHGPVSSRLYACKPGDAVTLAGPYGVFVLREPIARDCLFLASGTGISALKPMVYAALQKSNQGVWLFLGVRTEEEIMYREEFEILQRDNRRFHFVPVLSRQQWTGAMGHVQDVVASYIAHRDADIYLCGVRQMVEDAKAALEALGFPKERIFFEKYT